MKCKNMVALHFISKHEFRLKCDILNHCFNKLAEQVKTKGLCAENYAASVCELSEKRILTTDPLSHSDVYVFRKWEWKVYSNNHQTDKFSRIKKPTSLLQFFRMNLEKCHVSYLHTVKQGYMNPACWMAMVTEICMVVPNICGTSVRNLLHFTILVPRLLSFVPKALKNLCLSPCH
jgi:hypothetical protein